MQGDYRMGRHFSNMHPYIKSRTRNLSSTNPTSCLSKKQQQYRNLKLLAPLPRSHLEKLGVKMDFEIVRQEAH